MKKKPQLTKKYGIHNTCLIRTHRTAKKRHSCGFLAQNIFLGEVTIENLRRTRNVTNRRELDAYSVLPYCCKREIFMYKELDKLFNTQEAPIASNLFHALDL